MTRLMCAACGYKYTPKAAKIPKLCPNCGKGGTVQREPSAEDIIRDSQIIK